MMDNNSHSSSTPQRHISVPNEILIPEMAALIREGHTVTFVVRGFSMRPFLEHERDRVRLCAVGSHVIAADDVVLAEIAPKRYVLHRVERNDNGHLTLRGDGNVVGREYCTTDDVIGIVDAFYRKGREKADLACGRKWRLYSALWPSSPILRRIILGLRRRLWLPMFHQNIK